MKKVKYLAFSSILLLSLSCNSGKNAPADSHPGSGSVKAGSNEPPKEQKDSTQKDTVTRM